VLLAMLPVVARGDSYSHTGTLGVSTCSIVTGTVTPLYMAAGTCVDASEAAVEQPLERAGVLANLRCLGSTAFTGTVTLTGRTGPCGALADAPFTCTLTGNGSSRPSCTTGAAKLTVASAGHCWTLKLGFGGAISPAPIISCTVVRAL
jgi:hypothetical protein